MKNTKKLASLLVAVVVAIFAYVNQPQQQDAVTGGQYENIESAGNATAAAAFTDRRSGIVLTFTGRVERILADDNEGSRHQRFIVRDHSGMSVLVSHNIDLAPRVADIADGDAIVVHGEYEWNDRGGIIHWTHHDPLGSHEAGWISHAGRQYQ